MLIQGSLECGKLFFSLQWEEVVNRHFLINHDGLAFPAHTSNRGALINCGTNEVVHEVDAIQFGAELPVQNQGVLTSCLSIFEGDWLDLEEFVGTQERFSQSRVAPLSLTTNQLGLNTGATFYLGGFGRATDSHEIRPTLNVLHPRLVSRTGIFQVLLQIPNVWLFFPVGEFLHTGNCHVLILFHVRSHHQKGYGQL